MVGHAYNLSTWEAEAGGSQVPDQSELMVNVSQPSLSSGVKSYLRHREGENELSSTEISYRESILSFVTEHRFLSLQHPLKLSQAQPPPFPRPLGLSSWPRFLRVLAF